MRSFEQVGADIQRLWPTAGELATLCTIRIEREVGIHSLPRICVIADLPKQGRNESVMLRVVGFIEYLDSDEAGIMNTLRAMHDELEVNKKRAATHGVKF